MNASTIAAVALGIAVLAGCKTTSPDSSSPTTPSAVNAIANDEPAPPAADAAPVQPLADPERSSRAAVVLRVRRLAVGGGSKYIWERVEVLEVLKNTTDEPFDKPFEVARYSWKAGLPSGVSTVYLEPYGGHTQNLWRLLDADGAVGVSHSEPGATL